MTGQSSGELELTGVFLDTDGEPLLSRRPLRLLVHWSEPDALAVTDAVFRGDQAGLALLAVRGLPQDARVWGEVSEDGGKTWTRFPQENFFLVPYARIWAVRSRRRTGNRAFTVLRPVRATRQCSARKPSFCRCRRARIRAAAAAAP